MAIGWLLVVALVLLGNWQIERRAWKLDLIERVNARAFAEPVPPPASGVPIRELEYQRVRATGIFDYDRTVLVKAVTRLGPGYWVMTPLDQNERAIWINRGFIPQTMKDQSGWSNPSGTVEIVGLVRLTEPIGTLLETNSPSQDRWYSRDVAAMSKRFVVRSAASYFIDQQEPMHDDAWPRAGMTVLRFNNPHLVYALTWYALATLLAGALISLRNDVLGSR